MVGENSRSFFARGAYLWKIDDERRSDSRLAFEPDGPAVRLDNLTNDVKTESQSAECAR